MSQKVTRNPIQNVSGTLLKNTQKNVKNLFEKSVPEGSQRHPKASKNLPKSSLRASLRPPWEHLGVHGRPQEAQGGSQGLKRSQNHQKLILGPQGGPWYPPGYTKV